MRVNDKDIRIRRFRNEKLVSIEYMGYDKQHALQDCESHRVPAQEVVVKQRHDC